MVLFESVLMVSVYTSVIILILTVFSKSLRKRYSVKWRYFVWLFLALRLVLPIPFTLPKPLIEFSVPRMQVINAVVSNVQAENNSSMEASAAKMLQGEKEISSPVMEMGRLQLDFFAIWNTLWIIWLLGLVIYLIYHGMKYIVFLKDLIRNSRQLRDARVLEIYYDVCAKMKVKVRPQLLICEVLSSPLCTGFFNQKIFLKREEYQEDQLRYILEHELMHCKRRDVWYKALLLGTRGVHFFNPVVHWMVHMAERDLEYSCDALVLNHCSLIQREAYGLTILEGMGKRKAISPLTTAFLSGKDELRLRIDYIFDVKKKKRGTPLLLFLILTAWIGMAFVGCSTGNNTSPVVETLDSTTALYQCRMNYVGDPVGVGKILGKLALPEGIRPSEEGVELFTSEEPYGFRRYLTLEGGQTIPQDGWFEKDAIIFLSLVNNASFFEYAITDESGTEQILHFDRDDGAKYFGDTDLRSMSADEATFRNFLDELSQLFLEESVDG